MGRVDIITGTLGKVLAAHPAAIQRRVKEVVEWLRQRSRPGLQFSNSPRRRSWRASLKVLGDGGKWAQNLRDRCGERPAVPVSRCSLADLRWQARFTPSSR